MGKSLFARCCGAPHALGDAEQSMHKPITEPSAAGIKASEPALQMGDAVRWTPAEVQRWLASIGSESEAYNFESMTGQDLLELTDTEIYARVSAKKPAAKLAKAVQHLQRSWLQVTPTGPQPLSSTNDGTKVTVLRGTASGVINVPIDTAKPSDGIKACWTPAEGISAAEAGPSQAERNANVPIPSPLEAELAAERAVTEALAKDLSWYQTVIDNPLAGSKSVGGSTNTSPGGLGQTATMGRSASMALAAQAAAAASVRRQNAAAPATPVTPVTPESAASPSHTTHTYTPGSFTYSGSLSKELPTPEMLKSRRVELDGTEALSGGLAQTPSTQMQASPEIQPKVSDPAPNAAATSYDAVTQEAAAAEAEAVTARAQGPAQETAIQDQQATPLESERAYDKEERWQLPGLTGPDAIRPEEWQEFCTKVNVDSPSDSDVPNDTILQDRAELAEVANKNESDAAAAERAYVRSLVKRFEKSVGSNWPARRSMSSLPGDAGKENAEAVNQGIAGVKSLESSL